MFNKYFTAFNIELQKKLKASLKTGKAVKGKIEVKDQKYIDVIEDMLTGLIPTGFKIDKSKPVDSSGYSPEGSDLIIYRDICRDATQMFGGYIPCEAVFGAIHIIQDLNRKSLAEILSRVSEFKKLNKFIESLPEENIVPIPSFIIVLDTDYLFPDLKKDIIGFYNSTGLDSINEMDIIMLPNKGLIIKNWREKRSFIALETNEDTTMWFYILMSEYLDVVKPFTIDYRKYIRKHVEYTEY
jgi:hypothetical protein